MDWTILGYDFWEVAFELAVIWVTAYLVLRFLQGTRGGGVIKGLIVLLAPLGIFWLLASFAGAFDRLAYFAETFAGYVLLLLVIIFQPELRQAAVRVSQSDLFRRFRQTPSVGGSTIAAVADAARFLGRSQFGGLIAIERENDTVDHVIGGQLIDAEVSAPLLQSIFWPNNPLHDLGVIMRGDRIVKASVQFPLADETALPVELGSRHRAALGLSMRCDALVIIISEQTGRISLADQGVLTTIERDELEAELMRHLEQVPEEPPMGRNLESPAAQQTAAVKEVSEQASS
ncbi:MAG: diadenylate cyclase [Phycisphaerales bacterium]|jgi:diadenylate cyclase|nr:diadenylate cyclase [Phycisphaerales bacterium]